MKQSSLVSKLGQMILAVFISIFIWLVVVNVSDPIISTTYYNIPVVAINTESITSLGKVYDIPQEEEVSITVNAKRSVLDSLNSENFKATVDLATYDEETGLASVRVESNKFSDSIESMRAKVDSIRVDIEDMLKQQFIIVPVVIGEPEEGYMVGDVSTAENIVRVSGAQSLVSTIKKVTAEVNVSGLNSSIYTSVDLKFYDENDELVKDSGLTQNISTVAINAQLLEKKEIPVTVSGFSGEVANGYCVLGDITQDIDSFVIAGKSNQISSVNGIEIPAGAVNVDQMTETANIEVDPARYLPDGVVSVDPNLRVTVTVPIEKKQSKVLEAKKSDIHFTGIPEGYTAEITMNTEAFQIEVSGSQEDISNLSSDDVKYSVNWEEFMKSQDMEETKPGTYRIPLSISFAKENTISASKDIVLVVKISEKMMD